jgi:hypothetical protein
MGNFGRFFCGISLDKTHEGGGRPLGPDPEDEGVEGLADEGLEDSLEVEGGEVGHPGQLVQAELPADVLFDEVYDAVDPGHVLRPEELAPVEGDHREKE